MTIEPKHLARESVRTMPTSAIGPSPWLKEALASGRPIVRLAGNENLYGPSPRIAEAIRATEPTHLYPDASASKLREALGERIGVDPGCVLVSHGSENVLRATFQSLLAPSDRVVALQPTFLLAELLSHACEAEHVGVGYGDDLEFDANDVAKRAARGAKILYVSHPNNPTGNLLPPDALREIVAATTPETLIVLDEAYYEYGERDGSGLRVLMESARPYVVMRTFSKAYGLAALRVGYGICYHPELVSVIKSASTVFDVTSTSQLAAVAALGDTAHMERVVAQTLAERTRVVDAVTAQGARVFPSHTNFIALWYASFEAALKLEENLAKHAVLVKALPGRADEGIVRVTIGRPEDNERFLHAFEASS